MIRAVIFDMDGLIIDSEPIESESLALLLKRYGKTPIYNENGLIHVVGIAGDSYKWLKEKYGIEDEDKMLVRRKRRLFSKLLNKKLTPLEGLDSLIKLVKKYQLKTAVASNRNIGHVKMIINNLGITEFFDIIVGPSKRIRHKPTPDIYLAAARRLKIYPRDCLVLEDSQTGIIASKEAGMKVIAVPNKYTKNQDLSKADLIVDSLSDINWSTISNI